MDPRSDWFGSVFSLLDVGGAAVGTLVRGVLAQRFGLTTPYWLAAAAMLVIAAVAWRPLRSAPAG